MQCVQGSAFHNVQMSSAWHAQPESVVLRPEPLSIFLLLYDCCSEGLRHQQSTNIATFCRKACALFGVTVLAPAYPQTAGPAGIQPVSPVLPEVIHELLSNSTYSLHCSSFFGLLVNQNRNYNGDYREAEAEGKPFPSRLRPDAHSLNTRSVLEHFATDSRKHVPHIAIPEACVPSSRPSSTPCDSWTALTSNYSDEE